jgi:hypothetical protein
MIDRACSTNGKKRNVYVILAGKPEEKGRLIRPRLGLLDNIKIHFREKRLCGMDWINSPVVSPCEHSY